MNKIVLMLIIGLVSSVFCAEDLSIVSVTPQGDLDGGNQATAIQVTFNSPMVALSALPEGNGTGPLKISPATEGKFRWKGTDVLVFYPDKPFVYATEYHVTIPAGTKSNVKNIVLPNDYSWSFTTPRPRVVNVTPDPETENNADWYSKLLLNQPIYVRFNLPVDPEKVKQFLKIEPGTDVQITNSSDTNVYSGSGSYDNVNYMMNKTRLDIIKIIPVKGWKENTIYNFTFKNNLPSTVGTLGMNESYSFSQETFGNLVFKKFKSGDDIISDGATIKPEQNLIVFFNNEIVLKDLIPHIHFSPDVIIDDAVRQSTYESKNFNLNFSFAASTSYTITIDPELKDIYGKKLGKKVVFHFATESYSPYVKMTDGFGIVERNGKHRIPLELVNAKNIPFYLKQIPMDKIVNFMKTPNMFSSEPEFGASGGWTYTTNVGNSIPQNKRSRIPLYLDSALEKGGSGVVYAMIKNKYSSDQSIQAALLQVTNLGITAKFGYDNTTIVISSLDEGKKLPDVSVEIRDTNNKVLWTGVTGKEGIITAPSWKSLGIKNVNSWSPPILYVLAKKDNDWAFISSQWGSEISPYRFNINYESSITPQLLYSGTVITDRGVYRPGETVYCKGIVRSLENGGWVSVKYPRIEVTVIGHSSGNYSEEDSEEGEEEDGDGNNTETDLYKDTLPLSKPGSFECKFKIPDNAHLMNCTIRAHVLGFEEETKGNHEAIYGDFRIAEFRALELEVNVRSDKNDYTFGNNAEITVESNYLHGAPVKKAPLKWVLRRYPLYVNFDNFEGYSFYNGTIDHFEDYEYSGDMEGGYGALLRSDSVETDNNGKATIKLKLDRNDFKGSAVYELQATVEGKSAQPVSSSKRFNVHAGEYYLGLKPSTTFGEEGKPISIYIASVNQEGKRVEEKDIRISVIRRVWQSVRKAGVDGRWSWESEKTDSTCLTKDISTHSQDADNIEFTPDKSGYYIVTASSKDKHGNEINCLTTFYVTGKSYAPWMRTDDDILELITDKKNYSPGENARILVKSPYKQANALVTVEREGIIDSRWVSLDGTSDKIIIPIKNEYLPNVYVSVMIIRGRTSPLKFDDKGDDISKPCFKIGYVNLHVSPQSKHLAINLETDQKQYQPGDSVNVKIKVPKLNGKAYNSELLLMAVDEGVLMLSGYKTPDPFYNFFKERPLSVITSESRTSVIGERNYGEKGKNRGGGGGLSPALLSQLNDVKARGNFKICAYFNPKIKLDKNGEANIKFKLPDNLTTFRIMAVAHTEMSEFGGNDIKIRVNKKLMIRPILPRFVRVNDSLYAGVIAENYTSSKDTFFIKVDAENVSIPGSSTLKAVVPENGQSEIRFPILANSTNDSAKLTFKGILGKYNDGVTVKLPIVLERTMETVALTGNTSDSAIQQIELPDSTYNGIGKITTGLSSTALIGLNDGVSYLFEYPYGCLEQRTSKVLPLLLFEDMVKSFNIKTLKKNDSKEILQEYFSMLSKYQTSEGGFDYWTPASHPSPYLSAYVLLAIVKGEKKGFSIESGVKSQVIEYLSGILNGSDNRNRYPYGEKAWLSAQAFIVSVLAEAGNYEADDVERLYNARAQLALEAKCELIKAITLGNGDKKILADLKRSVENSITIESATAHFEEPMLNDLYWIHESNVKATAIALQTMVLSNPAYPHADKIVRWLMRQQKAGRWNTTQENLWVFWALADYFNTFEKETPDFTAQLKIDGKNWMEEMFKGRSSKQIRKETNLAELGPNKKLDMKLSKTGPGRLYYEVRMQYAKKGRLDARDEGFKISRKYYSLDNKEVNPSDFEVGKTIIVKLSIKTEKDRMFVAVNDPLPAGCEIIDPALASTDQEISRKISSISQSGDYWWGSWNHTEYKDQRCLLFADYLDAGSYEFCYAIRPIVSGSFYTPATYAEEMYSPEVFGRSDDATVKIKGKK